MSERRTAEIKFRCTPTFKASLAAAATAADQSLTEFIESAVGYAMKEQESWQEGEGAGNTRAIDPSDLRAMLEADCCAGHPVNAGTACDDCPLVPPLVPTVQSEYIEVAVGSALRTKQTRALDSALLANAAIFGTQTRVQDAAVGALRQSAYGAEAPAISVKVVPGFQKLECAAQFQNRTDDGTDTGCAGTCRPWEFCACKAEA